MISVLLPTLNEEQAIGDTIDRIRRVLPDAEIIVIDGLSFDNTIKIAEAKGVKILLCRERGKGKAIRMAIESANAEQLCLIDADGSYPPEALPAMLKLLDRYDAVVGERKLSEDSMSQLHRFGNSFLTFFANLLYQRYTPDVCSGMWVFNRCYKNIDIRADGFAIDANFYVGMCKKNFKLGSHPIEYRKRLGEAKIRWYHGVEILWFLIRERF